MQSARPSLTPKRPGEVVVETRNLVRELHTKDAAAETVLHGVSLSVKRGEFVALTGPSGSGKSTLLYLLGALDRPTSGEVWIDGVEISGLDDNERAAFRNEKLGFVFQFHFLLAEFTVLENVTIPMLRRGAKDPDQIEDHALDALDLLGIANLYNRRPSELSGGQQQRVSIARAIANNPNIILADEPTGNLDSKNGELVFHIFRRLVQEHGRTVIMVTHDPRFATRTNRQVQLHDGRIVEDEKREMFRNYASTMMLTPKTAPEPEEKI